MLVTICHTAQRNILEDLNLQRHGCENFYLVGKSYRLSPLLRRWIQVARKLSVTFRVSD